VHLWVRRWNAAIRNVDPSILAGCRLLQNTTVANPTGMNHELDILGGTTIRKPYQPMNPTVPKLPRTAPRRNVNRDYFGNDKNILTLQYNNVNYTDRAAINTLYQSYLTTKTTRIISKNTVLPMRIFQQQECPCRLHEVGISKSQGQPIYQTSYLY